jgi:hypothetical protein
MKTASGKANAPGAGRAAVNQAVGAGEANQNMHAQFTIDAEILGSKSTSTEVQLAKVLTLLRQGPKTTMELREHGIVMPAARVFQLKRERNYSITTELLPLFDAQGIRHAKCARYHLADDVGEV